MTALHRLAVVAAASLVVGCSAHRPPESPEPPLPPVSVQPFSVPGTPKPVALFDPEADLLARAATAFKEGRAELELGHLTAAREAFDRAVDVFLNAPGGARVTPTLDAAYQRLLDQITALEAQALHDGDGFTEVTAAPAVIDELLAASPNPPAPAAATAESVAADLAQTKRD